jgi:hypothetical protein
MARLTLPAGKSRFRGVFLGRDQDEKNSTLFQSDQSRFRQSDGALGRLLNGMARLALPAGKSRFQRFSSCRAHDVAEIDAMKHMQRLILDHTAITNSKVTKAGVTELRQALPRPRFCMDP